MSLVLLGEGYGLAPDCAPQWRAHLEAPLPYCSLQVEHDISLTDGLTLDKPEEVEVCVLHESWATVPGS